jgi:hypothetical protein
MRWYFLTDQQEQIPTSEEQLPSLAGQGVVRPQTLVWHEGQGDWKSLGEIKPELFSAGPVLRSSSLVAGLNRRTLQRSTDHLARFAPWMIALGALSCGFGIWGIIYSSIQFMNGYESWRVVSESVEGGVKPTVNIGLLVGALLGWLFYSAGSIWFGITALKAGAKLTQGGSSGEVAPTEEGLRLTGKCFLLLTIGLVVGLLILVGNFLRHSSLFQ